MDEQRLHEILGQNVEVPDMVDKKLKQAYAQMEGRRSPSKRRGLRLVRTVLVAVAVIAALCATATAAYQIFRQELPIDAPKTVEGILGNGQPSWKETYEENGSGNPFYWPNRETVEVDPEQAQALLGDYLPECGYQWQIRDYTFTVEGYVLDEHTGTAKFYYSVEHPGGFGEDAVNWERGTLNYTSRINVLFTTKSDVDRPWISGKIIFVDVERSTEEKLYLMEGAASLGGWKAEDGLNVTFKITGETDRDNDVLSANLELPGVMSLPVVAAVDPETGELAAAVSPIAVRADVRYLRNELPNGDVVWDSEKYLALEYTDGSRYVIEGGGMDNADYWMRDNEGYSVAVFNRLVDPSQVAAVIVDGQRYEMG